MQRFCSKLRTLSQIAIPITITPAARNSQISPPSFSRFYSSNSQFSSSFPPISSHFKTHFGVPTTTLLVLPRNECGEKYLQMRNFSVTSKEKKFKKLTPATSKVKKIKMKTISSFKGRFRTLNDGTIRRWREGKRHNAHLKSKKSKRRLRQPGIVPAAYAKVMKKMNFCAHY